MHRFSCRVYYEDTDMAGLVYHANHLKFIERARSEWVEAMGIDQTRLRAEAGIVFAVRRVEADYLRPMRFGERLTVQTTVTARSQARLILLQEIVRETELLFTARVTLVALDATGRPCRLPLPDGAPYRTG